MTSCHFETDPSPSLLLSYREAPQTQHQGWAKLCDCFHKFHDNLLPWYPRCKNVFSVSRGKQETPGNTDTREAWEQGQVLNPLCDTTTCRKISLLLLHLSWLVRAQWHPGTSGNRWGNSEIISLRLPQTSPREPCGSVRPIQQAVSLLGIYYNKPILSFLASPVVTSGANTTMKCVSWNTNWYNKFILTKEDQKLPTSLDVQYIHSSRQYGALFIMGPMTSNYTGTFRCYGYNTDSPQLWSVPSEPLEVLVSGELAPSFTNHVLKP